MFHQAMNHIHLCPASGFPAHFRCPISKLMGSKHLVNHIYKHFTSGLNLQIIIMHSNSLTSYNTHVCVSVFVYTCVQTWIHPGNHTHPSTIPIHQKPYFFVQRITTFSIICNGEYTDSTNLGQKFYFVPHRNDKVMNTQEKSISCLSHFPCAPGAAESQNGDVVSREAHNLYFDPFLGWNGWELVDWC